MRIIKKFFYLRNNYDESKGQKTIDDLNDILFGAGISFSVQADRTGKKLIVNIDEEMLKSVKEKNARVGRPVEKEINFAWVNQMQEKGMTNKEIYERLGVSKALFYKRLKEYKYINRRWGDKMTYTEGILSYHRESGRYGLLWSDLWEKDFHCGNHLQVYIDGEWIDTRIEMDSNQKWYLVDIDKPLEGLKIRVQK